MIAHIVVPVHRLRCHLVNEVPTVLQSVPVRKQRARLRPVAQVAVIQCQSGIAAPDAAFHFRGQVKKIVRELQNRRMIDHPSNIGYYAL